MEAKSKEGTLVQKNKAVQELAQLKAEDPLPLRKAKITQDAAVRKAEKAAKALEEATVAAQKRFEEAQKFLDVRSFYFFFFLKILKLKLIGLLLLGGQS